MILLYYVLYPFEVHEQTCKLIMLMRCFFLLFVN